MNALTIAHTCSGQQPLNLLARMANRHGLIAGATGTGKTVTLRKMAEALKDVKTAARTFRPNPALNTVQALTEMGKGEVPVSFLDDDGIPRPVQRAHIMPPQSRLAPLTTAERDQHFRSDPLSPATADTIERPAAYAALQAPEAEQAAEETAAQSSVAVTIMDANSPSIATPCILVPGQNSPLAARRLQLRLHWPQAPQFQPDYSIYFVGADGKVSGNDSIAIDLAAIPPAVQALHIAASIDAAAPYRNFGSLGEVLPTVTGEDGREAPLQLPLAAVTGGDNTALVFAQIYRRDQQWKIRAIGQGYRDGLRKPCEHHGVAVWRVTMDTALCPRRSSVIHT